MPLLARLRRSRAGRTTPPETPNAGEHPETEPSLRQAELLVEEAEHLAETGRLVDAIDRLAVAYRDRPEADLAVRLRDLRLRAAQGRDSDRAPGRSPWPPDYADPFPHHSEGLPEITADALRSDVLGSAVAYHGALIVRGLFDSRQVECAVDAVDRTEAARQRQSTGAPDPGWYQPVPLANKLTTALRDGVADQGGTWLADSPRSTALLLDTLHENGALPAIAEHFGERPLFSLQKSTLRRSAPVNKLVAWHQDGSFLDADVRTMNVWVALSRCGGDYPSPGLEVAPFRVPEVLPYDGALTPHSISDALVAELTAARPVIRPAFAPGDAMLFDERFLHRTYLNDRMTEHRYALECWFFAPSHPATGYVSLLA